VGQASRLSSCNLVWRGIFCPDLKLDKRDASPTTKSELTGETPVPLRVATGDVIT
jgi:hypothetical protein